MNIFVEKLFSLLRLALGSSAETVDLSDLQKADWEALVDTAFEQGVAALVADGLERVCPESVKGGADGNHFLESDDLEDLRYKLVGVTLACEKDYLRHWKTVRSLFDFYKEEGIPTMLLKGYGLSLNYPVPEHRPVGDIDIYQFGRWEEADALMREQKGIVADNSHHHHSVFVWRGTMVENHYDMVNVHSHRSSADVERTLKKYAAVGESVDGIDLPTADFNALFVIRHMAAHFSAERMSLRQLLDWTLFVREHSAEVDWKMAWECYRRWNMHWFVLCIDEIAVRYLGVERALFGIPVEFEGFASGKERFAGLGATGEELVERVLEEVFHPTNVSGGRVCMPVYVWRRFRQWWNSRWKHRIVYSDSLISTFIWQLWSHLMKPATLVGK